jgi:ferredoxin-NADP reductase
MAEEVHLLWREEIAAGTMSLRLGKPPGFRFKSGQALDLILPRSGVALQDCPRHAFSLVSAPSDTVIELATRVSDSDYKRALAALPLGASVLVDGPFGALGLHKDATRAAVFIAGGIGITPFISMLRHAMDAGWRHDIVLLYSNRRPEDSAYLGELQQIATAQPRFRLLATMTEMEKSTHAWSGDTAPIDAALIRKAAQGLVAPLFYVVGPPRMVSAVRMTLMALDVDDDDIRSEDFHGY